MASITASAADGLPVRRGYVPAVGPRLKVLLAVVFALVALLGANSVYLLSVTFLDWWTGHTYENWFYHYMFLGHLVLGLMLVLPFLAFALQHMWNTRSRKNKRAIRVGYGLFWACIALLTTGLMLMRFEGFDLKTPSVRAVVYWVHVAAPVACLWLYWLHRLAGPRINWKGGIVYALVVFGFAGGMLALHNQDPRDWNVVGPKSGAAYFAPSQARTATGNFIPAQALMNDAYCLKCHPDAYDGWVHSAHHFSSFNNPMYLASVRETRAVALKRDGNVQAARWCAGCHDPVPFFSGAFDDPNFDDVRHVTAHAGITCTTCHAITNVNSNRGNADYTIEEPEHYPFAFSENAALQWINNQLIKAKPALHKKTFLKPHHKTAEFCSTCHKVGIPGEVNHYKEFLRGQNHYDTYLLSGASGHGARSFYYPELASENCASCHMPAQPSNDFGAKPLSGLDKPGIHNHLFPGANTALPFLRQDEKTLAAHAGFLQEKVRVDIFGLIEGSDVSGKLIAPLRPTVPELKTGQPYLLEAVLRTLKLGHPFTQGTVDSNEVWLDVTVRSGDRVIGRSGGLDEQKQVDPWSHFVNVFMLDRDGNRIDRRNAQDIFVPLYNNQIPPGAAQVAHFALTVPDDVTEPVTIDVKLQYRKFDQTYMDFVTKNARPGDVPIYGYEPGTPYINELPIVTLAADTITLPVAGRGHTAVANAESKIPLWQRWNDYGIGLLLKGKAQLRQAEEAFKEVEQLNRFDGPLNLARVYQEEGDLDQAVQALDRAAQAKEPAAPPWTLRWLSGVVARQQGQLDEAEKNFRAVLTMRTEDMVRRGFDFSLDYEVINLLGTTLFDQAKRIRGDDRAAERKQYLEAAVEQFQKTLSIDSENFVAHYQLQLLYHELGQEELAQQHRELHERYKPDDNARDRAVVAARQKYPAANHAAEAVVVYRLNGSPTSAPAEPAKASTPDVETAAIAPAADTAPAAP